jgi:hypothetical protein
MDAMRQACTREGTNGGVIEPSSRYLRSMLGNLLHPDWTMFDLRPVRQDFNAPAGATNPDLQRSSSASIFWCWSPKAHLPLRFARWPRAEVREGALCWRAEH